MQLNLVRNQIFRRIRRLKTSYIPLFLRFSAVLSNSDQFQATFEQFSHFPEQIPVILS